MSPLQDMWVAIAAGEQDRQRASGATIDSLDLDGCGFLTDTDVATALSTLPHLSRVSVAGDSLQISSTQIVVSVSDQSTKPIMVLSSIFW